MIKKKTIKKVEDMGNAVIIDRLNERIANLEEELSDKRQEIAALERNLQRVANTKKD